MRDNRLIWCSAFALITATCLTAWLVIIPNYREAGALRRRIAELELKVKTIDRQTSEIEALAEAAESARSRIDRDLKDIPVGDDLAGLIQKLSLPIDHARVMDQTFTAGAVAEAIPTAPAKPGASAEAAAPKAADLLSLNLQAKPLTVDMVATFDSIFALIRAAESMDRLVRITTLRVMCKRDEQTTDTPVLRASVGLEAIFDQQ